ncbi:MAG: CBS domain-containing protein [Saprospiraceae bacterium]|nr:CBS domain-containing protein [Saprospiraceae bacterium]
MNIPIDSIISRNLKTLHPKDKLVRAKEIFNEFDIHHIPIHVMGDVRGILSLGDILFLEGFTNNTFDEFLKNKKLQLTTVDEVMTSRPFCADVDDLVSEVLETMIENRVNALPVKENDELVGIITTFDILKYFKNNLNN